MIASLSLLFLASIGCASPIVEVRQGSQVPTTATPAFTPKAFAVSSAESCVSTTTVTVTRLVDTSSSLPTETLVSAANSSPSSSAAAITSVGEPGLAPASPTTPISVSGAGGALQPSAAAEANKFDDTAVRPIKGASLKSSTGNCLFVDPTAGDFRENLIPIAVQPCTGAAGEKFDFVTSGKHNNVAGGTASLIVSSLTNGCLNFDPRRAVNPANIFSCGGRADGGGDTTGSQLFPFTPGETSVTLAPQNSQGQICLVDNAGKLDQAPCNGDASQVFTIA